MAAAVMALGLAGSAAADQTCPTDPLAPLHTPQVQLDQRPRPDGGAASYGGMQYRRTPGLGPRDIALTLDDGPSPQVTPIVLKILARHCLKVTYFLVGWYAHAYPDLVRQEADAGDFIGTHTFTHPDNMRRLSTAAAEQEIVKGFQAAEGALKDGTPAEKAQLAPFFRFPGLNDTKPLSQWLAQRDIAVVGADFGANDWLNISSDAVEHRALIEAAQVHGGILILHDSHMRTAEALDDLITTFERDGYHFVQLVPPAGAQAPDFTRGGPIIGSRAEAAPRDPPPPASGGADQMRVALHALFAQLAYFARWFAAELGRLWAQALASLRH